MTKLVGVAALALTIFLVATAESCSSSSPGMAGTSPGSTSASSAVSAAATATPRAAATPLALSGQGSKVTDPFQLAAGNYRVSWSATGATTNFIVHIHAGTNSEGLVNEIPPNPASGEAFFQAAGGQYFLEVDASTLTWSITFTQIAG